MKTNSRWSFVYEGLKQAGLVLGVCLLVGGIGWIILSAGLIGSGIINVLIGLPTVCGISLLAGPVPTLLTCFDITNGQLLWMSCVLIIPYWACLGTIAGLSQRPDSGLNENQPQNLSAKQMLKRIRWKIEIVALVIAVLFFFSGPLAYHSGGHFAGVYRSAVSNVLRQVDAARNEFILEKKPSTNYLVTEFDLTPYIKLDSKGKIPRFGPVRYVLNPADQPVYAVLDSDWRIPRKGWQEGFTFTNQTVFKLP